MSASKKIKFFCVCGESCKHYQQCRKTKQASRPCGRANPKLGDGMNKTEQLVRKCFKYAFGNFEHGQYFYRDFARAARRFCKAEQAEKQKIKDKSDYRDAIKAMGFKIPKHISNQEL